MQMMNSTSVISYPVRRHQMHKVSGGALRMQPFMFDHSLTRQYVMVNRPHEFGLNFHHYLAKTLLARRGLKNPIREYLDEAFGKLASRLREEEVTEPRFDEAVLLRLHRALIHSCEPDTVYPHISPDGEGGVVATWFAGDLMIEIVCDPDLRLEFVKQTGLEGTRVPFDPASMDSLRPVREEIRALTALVKARNPSWRAIFRPS